MKKLFFILSLFATLLVGANELPWSSEYSAALAKAKKEHKMVYVLITSTTCPYCHKFKQRVLSDKEVQKRLLKDFVPVELVRDFDDVPKEFATSPIPRHYFVDAEGEIVYDSLGMRKKETFLNFLEYAKEENQLLNEESK